MNIFLLVSGAIGENERHRRTIGSQLTNISLNRLSCSSYRKLLHFCYVQCRKEKNAIRAAYSSQGRLLLVEFYILNMKVEASIALMVGFRECFKGFLPFHQYFIES